MGRVRGCGRVGSLAFSFRSVRGGVLSLTIRNHWFLGKRVAEVGSHLDVQYPPCPNQIMVNELVVAWVSPSSESSLEGLEMAMHWSKLPHNSGSRRQSVKCV